MNVDRKDNNMQRKIGEVFTTKDGVTLKVESNSEFGCIRCKFIGYSRSGSYSCTLDGNTAKITGACRGVIFVEVEPKKE